MILVVLVSHFGCRNLKFWSSVLSLKTIVRLASIEPTKVAIESHGPSKMWLVPNAILGPYYVLPIQGLWSNKQVGVVRV